MSIAASFGLYDTLPERLHTGEWSNTPTVEYRLAVEALVATTGSVV